MSTVMRPAPAVEEMASVVRIERPDAFQKFLHTIETDLLQHPIIVDNHYTRWFSNGQANLAELRHFAVQFSVFSSQFLLAQLNRMINAESLESMRAAKEILANEIGVVFNNRQKAVTGRLMSEREKDREGDPELVSTTGSVDGGTFYFRAGHFEWLLKFGKALGLTFADMGKRRHGTASTLFFVDELIRLYRSDDPNIATGASFAVETWATASNFWQQLEDGLVEIQDNRMPELSIAFFTWHNRIEAQHVAHIQDELEAIFEAPDFSMPKFMEGAREALHAISVFWNGLEADRLRS